MLLQMINNDNAFDFKSELISNTGLMNKSNTETELDVIIIGAGAAGLMCAIEAGKRGRTVLVIDHAKRPGQKIRISGGGRCNFTNINASAETYISQNPHFCKSALSQFTPNDFIQLVRSHHISFHEKKLGQQFCDNSSQEIISLLLEECQKANVKIIFNTTINAIKNFDNQYILDTSHSTLGCHSLVIATGGLSLPDIGATAFGFQIAKQFNINIIPTRAGLVPLTFTGKILELCQTLSGSSIEVIISCNNKSFRENLLFTHRGLSGPAILQISSYWIPGNSIAINLSPDINAFEYFIKLKQESPKISIELALSNLLFKRLASFICLENKITGCLAEISDQNLKTLASHIHQWQVTPSGTEGYRTAEVTVGGIDTAELSSKTMEVKKQPGLYFIGEIVDVTGHLGGYNLQWAWSSGFVAGQHV